MLQFLGSFRSSTTLCNTLLALLRKTIRPERCQAEQSMLEYSTFKMESGLPQHSLLASSGEYNTMEEQRLDFVKDLPLDTKEYNYSGFEHLEQILGHYEQPFVIFNNVSPGEFEKHQDHFPGRLDYSPISHVLILNMPSTPHEDAASNFEMMVLSKARDMSLEWYIFKRGATRVKTPEREKQADRSWSPRPTPLDRSFQWPTVTLEVAFSETRAKVKRDIGWWLNKSTGDVLMGITIDIKRQSGNIYINSWERSAAPTTANPNPEPRSIQEIKIIRRQPPETTGGDLVIPFRHMMLRDAGPEEGDWVFMHDELLKLAEEIWDAMDQM